MRRRKLVVRSAQRRSPVRRSYRRRQDRVDAQRAGRWGAVIMIAGACAAAPFFQPGPVAEPTNSASPLLSVERDYQLQLLADDVPDSPMAAASPSRATAAESSPKSPVAAAGGSQRTGGHSELGDESSADAATGKQPFKPVAAADSSSAQTKRKSAAVDETKSAAATKPASGQPRTAPQTKSSPRKPRSHGDRDEGTSTAATNKNRDVAAELAEVGAEDEWGDDTTWRDDNEPTRDTSDRQGKGPPDVSAKEPSATTKRAAPRNSGMPDDLLGGDVADTHETLHESPLIGDSRESSRTGSDTEFDASEIADDAGSSPPFTSGYTPLDSELVPHVARKNDAARPAQPDSGAPTRPGDHRPTKSTSATTSPSSTTSGPLGPSKFHVCRDGDTLQSIAREYLGDASRWRQIFAANAGLIANPELLPIGAKIIIPSPGLGTTSGTTSAPASGASGGSGTSPAAAVDRRPDPISGWPPTDATEKKLVPLTPEQLRDLRRGDS